MVKAQLGVATLGFIRPPPPLPLILVNQKQKKNKSFTFFKSILITLANAADMKASAIINPFQLDVSIIHIST